MWVRGNVWMDAWASVMGVRVRGGDCVQPVTPSPSSSLPSRRVHIHHSTRGGMRVCGGSRREGGVRGVLER